MICSPLVGSDFAVTANAGGAPKGALQAFALSHTRIANSDSACYLSRRAGTA